MSKAEILDALAKLNSQERQEIRLRLAELDQDEWIDAGVLTDTEKNIIEERLRDFELNPQNSIPWETAKDRLLTLLKR